MAPFDIVQRLQAVEKRLLAALTYGKQPREVLASGQMIWSDEQILNKDQICPGMVLVRVVGADQQMQTVIAVTVAFMAGGSWWYSAINLSEPNRLYKYSLGDAGIVESVKGWSENFLLDTDHSIDFEALNLLLTIAKP